MPIPQGLIGQRRIGQRRMRPDRPGPEGAASADRDGHAADPGETGPQAQDGMEDMKRRFREALDRKRGPQAGGVNGGQGTGKVHGSQGPASSRRSFRRKSG